MKFYFLVHLILPSPNTKSQGAKNDSVFGKMKEFVRFWFFQLFLGELDQFSIPIFLGKERKKNLLKSWTSKVLIFLVKILHTKISFDLLRLTLRAIIFLFLEWGLIREITTCFFLSFDPYWADYWQQSWHFSSLHNKI